MQLDRTNLMILDALQQNGRLSVSDLARLLGRGESTVRDRLVSLQRNGLLQGFRAIVDPAGLGYPVQAIVRARCEGRQTAELARMLQAIPEVVGAWFCTGPHPVRIEVRCRSLEDLGSLMEDRLVPLGLKGVEVVIMLQTLVEPRPVPAQAGSAPKAGPSGSDEGLTIGGDLSLVAVSAGPR